MESVESLHGKKGKGKARARTEHAISDDEWKEKRPSTSQKKHKVEDVVGDDDNDNDMNRGWKPPTTTGKR